MNSSLNRLQKHRVSAFGRSKNVKLRNIVMTAGLALVLSACAAAETEPTPVAELRPTLELPTAETAQVTLPTSAPLQLGVTASGEIAARSTADLTFRVPGTVAEVLVEEGMLVQVDQELARLDTRDLELQVAQAEAGLAQAQANYERLLEGATDEEIAAASAQVAQAQAALRQTQGSVTDADIAAAEAALQQAIAVQADLQSGPDSNDLQQAQAGVNQARANLEVQRTNLSSAKTNAELNLEVAANGLRDAQDAYSDIYWDNRETERTLDKFDLELPDEARDAEEQALRRVRSAEAQVEQARVALEQARQNEIDGLAAAEAQVSNAQAQLQRVLDGATDDQLAAAAAQVANAQANLERLRGEQRAGSLQSAQAGIASAQANLERLIADPTEATIAGALAQVASAEAALEAARLNVDKAILRAPFAGVVAVVDIDPGDQAGTGLPVMQVVDTSELRVEVDVSDTDVARVRVGQPVDIRVDAIPGESFSGTVTFVAPTATVIGNIRTYTVRITLDNQQESLRAGMSARVSIAIE
jgi:multidrug resistance efflux pump